MLNTLLLGVRSLLAHPLRSLLTALGIFIGVASVIWLLAVAEGISTQAQEQIAALGANNIIVRSVKPSAEASAQGTSRGPAPYGLTREDFNRLRTTIPTVVDALPMREMRRQFRYLGNQLDGRLAGVTPDYLELKRLSMRQGIFITDAASGQLDNVCVLSPGVARRLFPAEDAVGKDLGVDAEYYKVCGVLEAPEGDTADDLVYIPLTTLWERIGDTVAFVGSGTFEGETVELSQVTLRVDSIDNVMKTASVVRDTLAGYHPLEDYSVLVPLELLAQARTTRLMFIAFMGLIAAISLLVGGIGIMNIMLATVTERTREIGIRRALGARRRDITRQFLTETVLLSALGGISGVLGGLACGPIFSLGKAAADKFAPQMMASLPDVLRAASASNRALVDSLALGISVCVGVAFGIYPARRAAQMDPIEALRHE